MQPITVGILGGMGPQATVDLMQRVIALTPAEDDVDHIPMLIDNNPKVPSRIKALIEKTGPSPGPVISQMAAGLEKAGADLLAMPCNTAHHYWTDIVDAVDIPFLNMVALTAKQVARTRPDTRRVGLLASTALAQIALYEPWFAAEDIEIVYPDVPRQSALMQLIAAVKAGRGDLKATALNNAAAAIADAGADSLLIACTELSVLAPQLRSPLEVDDSAQVLATEIVARASAGPGHKH